MPKATLTVAAPSPLSLDVQAYGVRTEADYYEGSYVFTPSANTQTIDIAGKQARENITINPIPSNYGLITWNGATLTVS